MIRPASPHDNNRPAASYYGRFAALSGLVYHESVTDNTASEPIAFQPRNTYRIRAMTGCVMRWFLVVSGLLAAVLLTACGSSGAPAAAHSASARAGSGRAADTIVIKNFMYSPMSLTVAPGATVHIHNEDTVTHTFTDKADPGLFNTGDIAPGQTKNITAPGKAGSYPYICMIHQFMSGTLRVS
jgi:plastocyanin